MSKVDPTELIAVHPDGFITAYKHPNWGPGSLIITDKGLGTFEHPGRISVEVSELVWLIGVLTQVKAEVDLVNSTKGLQE